MDLSSLSDDELHAIAAGDLSKVSDDTLHKIAGTAPQTEDKVIEEMHPAFTLGDRFLVKNFGNDDEASARYLKQQHPELDVKAKNGKILAKGPGEDAYRVLDPDTGIISKDIGYDLLDLPADAITGILSGTATAGGGLVGGLPGAVAAGGISNAGLEAARQAIGKALGVNDDVKGADVAISGALGAASPLLFGSGASAGQIAKQGAKEFAQEGGEYLTKEAAQKGLEDTIKGVAQDQRGLVTRVAPKLGSMASGIDKDAINYAKENSFSGIDALKDPTAYRDFVSGKRAQWQGAVKDAMGSVGEAGEKSLEGDATVSLERAAQPFRDLVADLESRTQTPAVEQQTNAVKALFEHHFGVPIDQPLPEVSGADAQFLKTDLGELAKIQKVGTSDSTRTGLEGMGAEAKRIAGAAREAAGNLRDDIHAAIPERAKSDAVYSQLSRLDDEVVGKYLKNNDTTARTLSKLSPQKTPMPYASLQNLDQTLGTDVLPTSQLMRARDAFHPALSSFTSEAKKRAPLAVAGGLAGYVGGEHSGAGPGSAKIGGFAGGALGALAGGPSAMRLYINAGRFGRDNARPLFQYALPSAWHALLNERSQETP